MLQRDLGRLFHRCSSYDCSVTIGSILGERSDPRQTDERPSNTPTGLEKKTLCNLSKFGSVTEVLENGFPIPRESIWPEACNWKRDEWLPQFSTFTVVDQSSVSNTWKQIGLAATDPRMYVYISDNAFVMDIVILQWSRHVCTRYCRSLFFLDCWYIESFQRWHLSDENRYGHKELNISDNVFVIEIVLFRRNVMYMLLHKNKHWSFLNIEGHL